MFALKYLPCLGILGEIVWLVLGLAFFNVCEYARWLQQVSCLYCSYIYMCIHSCASMDLQLSLMGSFKGLKHEAHEASLLAPKNRKPKEKDFSIHFQLHSITL